MSASPDSATLLARYGRMAAQLAAQLDEGPKATTDPVARMATICALLHAKLPHFFWTGFYRLVDGDLVVGPYQGPLACAKLPPPDGVCWAGLRGGETVLVPDVHAFPGHVACDSRSRSEIVVPVRDATGAVVAVLDVDSDQPDAFGPADREGLEAIVALVHAPAAGR
ncbi:GAF domain-containing protein [bacterium]|nr:GAF domain-containing protein [bacterium]